MSIRRFFSRSKPVNNEAVEKPYSMSLSGRLAGHSPIEQGRYIKLRNGMTAYIESMQACTNRDAYGKEYPPLMINRNGNRLPVVTALRVLAVPGLISNLCIDELGRASHTELFDIVGIITKSDADSLWTKNL